MSRAGSTTLCHLGWRDNRDGFDVALAVNRLLRHGAAAWWLTAPQAAAEAGDYVVALDAHQRRALARLEIRVGDWSGAVPSGARPLVSPSVCLFAGTASRFPYFAYYALALLRLGLDYVPCDGASLAHDVLDDANLLVLPGGFSTWGIDAAETAPGADARVRDFLSRGGTAIGSCGGAFYLSSGRPGWTGTAQAKPLYTHEYLQSGVGVVTLRMQPGPLAFGCPPTVEVPYYHGPIYDELGAGIEVAATFHTLSLPGRLAIDNPLDAQRFQREMAGKPAILDARGSRGRAVLFSPHPEMGDLVRKYIALDGYVRHYLPIRGFGTMRDTLRHYRVTDAPSFRLVLNAVHHLMCDEATRTVSRRPSAAAHDDGLVDVCRRALETLPPFGAGEENELLRDVASGIGARLDVTMAEAREARPATQQLAASMSHLEATMRDHFANASGGTAAQHLMEADLAVALLQCATRVARFDVALTAR
jgi:CobB/CobQ-like glutamine amidotransferase domain